MVNVEPSDLEERTKLLEDKEALHDLLNQYCRTADAKDWDSWSLSWTEDALFEYAAFGRHRGRQRIRDVCASAEDRYASMQHSICNRQFSVTGNHANGEAQLLFVGVLHPVAARRHYRCGGRYTWTFVRTSLGWRISRMRLVILWEELPR